MGIKFTIDGFISTRKYPGQEEFVLELAGLVTAASDGQYTPEECHETLGMIIHAYLEAQKDDAVIQAHSEFDLDELSKATELIEKMAKND